MNDIYDVASAIRAYQSDTGGHFFDADTMRFFGCRVTEATIMKDDTGEVTRVLFVMRQLRNGFESDEKIYRVALYTPGSEHRCECCGQRDQRGSIDYVANADDGRDDDGRISYDLYTLRAARKTVSQYVAAREAVTL